MELKRVIEAILFSSQKPLSLRELREVLSGAAERAAEDQPLPFAKVKEEELRQTLGELEREHADAGRSHYLACVAGSWQFVSRPEFMPWLRSLFGVKNRPARLSQPALETLAIIAYRQPVTRAEVEQIRGVAVDGVVATLLERGLIDQAGRAEVVGRPMTYATTNLFLEYFGLRDLGELPAAEELRRIVVQKPDALLTAETPQLPLANSAPDAETPPAAAETPGEQAPSSESSPAAEQPAEAGDPPAQPKPPAGEPTQPVENPGEQPTSPP